MALISRAGWGERLRWWIWVALLVTLPVTSFPFFPTWAGLGQAIVRPLPLYPLALLLAFDLVPYLLRGGALPLTTRPLLWFAGVSLLTTALALLAPAPDLRGAAPVDRAVRALVTLAIGLGFYLTTVRMTRQAEARRRSIRWMWVGMGLAVGWGMLQGSRLLFRWPSYIPINTVQRLLSVRDAHLARVSGFAYEPSWFADQLAVLALPFLLAGLFTGERLFSDKRWGRAVELVLLAASVFVLVLTYSRGGLLASLVSAAVAWIALRSTSGRRRASAGAARPNRLARSAARLLGAAGALAVIAVLLSRSGYFSLLWTRLDRIGDPREYLASVGGGSRLALAEASWEVFETRPWTGVGLGQSGFYLLDALPDWAADRDVEVRLLLVPTSTAFPNPKNLWMRLLAETGLIGVLLFAAFMAVILVGCLSLLGRRETRARTVGLAGVMTWVAMLVEGISLDSFALPTPWIALGIVTGTLWSLGESPEQDATADANA